MSHLSRFIDRCLWNEDKVKIGLFFGALAVAGSYWLYAKLERVHISEETVIGRPLYGQELKDFIAELDQSPNTSLEALELGKAMDRLIADISSAAESAVEIKNGKPSFAQANGMASSHITSDRYDPVGAMRLALPSLRTRYNGGVIKHGTQAKDKLAVVSAAIAQFKDMVDAIEEGDEPRATEALDKVQGTLDAYIARFHAAEEDIDHSTKELIVLSRELDSLIKPLMEASRSNDLKIGQSVSMKRSRKTWELSHPR